MDCLRHLNYFLPTYDYNYFDKTGNVYQLRTEKLNIIQWIFRAILGWYPHTRLRFNTQLAYSLTLTGKYNKEPVGQKTLTLFAKAEKKYNLFASLFRTQISDDLWANVSLKYEMGTEKGPQNTTRAVIRTITFKIIYDSVPNRTSVLTDGENRHEFKIMKPLDSKLPLTISLPNNLFDPGENGQKAAFISSLCTKILSEKNQVKTANVSTFCCHLPSPNLGENSMQIDSVRSQNLRNLGWVFQRDVVLTNGERAGEYFLLNGQQNHSMQGSLSLVYAFNFLKPQNEI